MAKLIDDKFTLKPLLPQYFVGRREQVYRILYNGLIARTPNLLNLRGPQKIGRTSLLHFIQFLTRTDGKNTEYFSIFKESTNNVKLLCPYIDLRVLSSSRLEEIKTTFIKVLAQSVYEQSSHNIAENTLFGLMEAMAKDRQHHFILLIDRAEYLLNQQIQENINDILGVLNDSVANLGILLSFGASGELSAQDVIHRTEEIDQRIASISSLMNLVRYDIDIDLLQPDEAQEFLDNRDLAAEDQSAYTSFSEEEIDWILDVAGTHPYLLNLLAILVREQKRIQQRPLTTKDYSEVKGNAANQVKQLMNNIWKRLSELKDYRDLQAPDLAFTIASSASHAIAIDNVSEELVRILEGEGLVQKSNAHLVMLSGLLRELLIEYKRENIKSLVNTGYVQISPNTLVVRTDGVSQFVELTDKETRIMEMLLNAAPDELITSEDFLEKIWGPSHSANQQILSQRLKSLRNKLKPILNENPIENVYGTGYRLIKPERFGLQS